MSSSELTGAELEAAGMREIDSAVATSRAAQDSLDNNALQQAIRERRAAGDAAPLKLGVLISGSGTNLQAIIDRIADGTLNASVELVVSSRPSAKGLQRAEKAGIQTLTLSKDVYADPLAADEVISANITGLTRRTTLSAMSPGGAAGGSCPS